MGYWWKLSLLLVASSACVFGAGSKVVKKRNRAQIRWFEEKDHHEGRILSDENLSYLSKGNLTHFESVLDAILIPRVVGTEGHKKVRDFIVSALDNLNWTVEQDTFQDETPIGRKSFTNVIATLDPSAQRRLVLACHYDSKITPNGFLGAIDSAVPCSMLINLAHVLQKELAEHRAHKGKVTLQLLFIDGEEAFKTWSDTDSLYGARYMASKMQESRYPLGASDNTNELHRMDLFVLLDLIGNSDCSFVSFFENTRRWYDNLYSFERKLVQLGHSQRFLSFPHLFNYRKSNSLIEDDHIPFLRRGVPILHLICVPFPSLWHTIHDNRENLHDATIDTVNILMRAFVCNYLRLSLP